MITRINFLEKTRIQITYAKIVGAIAGVVLLCALLYGFLWLNSLRTKKTVQSLQADVEQLKKEREQMISQQNLIQGEGPTAAIQQALENTPSWSTLFNSITTALPPRVWLGSLISASSASGPSKRELIMNGQAKGAQVLALFLADLQKSPYFDKVTLTTSTEEPNGMFQFTISCDIGSNKWISKP